MNIEDQVCSLEHAKRLKELGVNQESLFYWVNSFEDEDFLLIYKDNIVFLQNSIKDIFCAFTVSELGEMLGDQIASGKGGKQYNEEYVCFSIVHTKEFKPKHKAYQTTAKTEANARAEMLIYLIASKFIEINKEVKHESARQ